MTKKCTLRTKLKEYRIESGLTLKEVGKYLGVSESTVCSYEIGTRDPKMSTMTKYAQLFKTSVEELFF